jgi:hypothetical protein
MMNMLRKLNASETPSLYRCWKRLRWESKRKKKTPKNNDWKVINPLLSVPEWASSRPSSTSKSDVRGPASDTMKKHKARLRWHRKVMVGMGRVPNGTWKAFDNLSKLGFGRHPMY